MQKAFHLFRDDILELSSENESLKSKKGSFDEKWSEESKGELLKQIEDEKGASLIMSRKQKQEKKQKINGL